MRFWILLFLSAELIAKSGIDLYKINESVYVHTTYKQINGYDTPSNGLLVISSEGIILIDTPWDDEQTVELIEVAKKNFNKEIVLAIISHAHEDRIGGINTLLENKIKTIGYKLTAIKAKELGYKEPACFYREDTSIVVGSTLVNVFYPGPAHTVDNIVIWLSLERILFGGCMIKSLMSESLGNVSDADVNEWPNSISKLLTKYDDAEIVVPGHGKWGGKSLIHHTLSLLKQKK
ncbi:MAG: subclass B1 metallo-beta-lactamase [Ignavibacteriales bacterium]|nr:MAG: subclass B1 metallo-beta-lactamase [Ignavibacteriales bacterium]